MNRLTASPDRPESRTDPESIRAWLCPQQIVLDVDVRDRHHLLRVAAKQIAQAHALDPEPVFRALWRREQVGTTALGHGVAIPHARIAGIARPLTLYLRAKLAVDCEAPDGKFVAHFMVIMVPADGHTDDHLQLLALVAQTLADETFRRRLVEAATPEQVASLFSAGLQLGSTHAAGALG